MWPCPWRWQRNFFRCDDAPPYQVWLQKVQWFRKHLLDKAGHVFFRHVEYWEISFIIIKATYFGFFATVVFCFTAQNVAAEVYRGMDEWKCCADAVIHMYTASYFTTLHNVMIIFVAVAVCFLLLLCARWHSTVCNGTKNVSYTLLLTPWGFLVDCAQGQGHPLHTPTWTPKSVWRASCCCWRWSGLCRNLAMDKSSPALEHLGPRWRWLGEYRPGHEGTWSVDTVTLQDCHIRRQDNIPKTGLNWSKVQTMSVNDQTMRHRR